MRSNSRQLRIESLEDRRMLAVVTVNSANDSVNGNITSIAALLANSGADGISLREAILAANNTAGKDTIQLADNLANGAFNPHIPSTIIRTINLTITDDVIIQGPAGGPAILQGPAAGLQQFMGLGRIMDVAANANVTIKGLWFQGGDVVDTENFAEAFGGAIRNAGNLTLTNCTFYDNYAGYSSLDGGFGGGAAIYNTGALTVIGSSFAANMAVYGSGGAILNAGTATVTNSTFSNNWAGYSGGAIFNAAGGNLTVTNCTMVDNGSNGTPTLAWPIGHGSITNAGTLALHNTVVARTTHGNDVENTGTISGNHNFIGDGSGSLAGTLSGNPLLQPAVSVEGILFLPKSQDGIRPFTLSPFTGSPLIDAGTNSVATYVDQRGVPRINNGTIDIGAVEVVVAPVTIVVTTLVDEDDRTIDPTFGAGTSLREAMSTFLPANTTITFAPGLAGTIALASPLGLNTSGSVAIIGPGAGVVTLDGRGIFPVPGDFNQDRTVNAADYVVWRKTNGSAAQYAEWRSNFGKDAGIPGGGGILNVANASVAISGLTFANGKAFTGGAIQFENTAQGSITNCTFVGNAAVNDGGAIYGNVSVANCTFVGNFAKNGGAFFSRGGTVSNSTFSYNRATDDGGAVYVETAQLTVINSTFSHNSANRGGALELFANGSGTTTTFGLVTGSTFVGNSADLGGAIDSRAGNANYRPGIQAIFDNTFYQNTAATDGGVIINNQGLNFSNNTLSENAVTNGSGAIIKNTGSFPGTVTLSNNIVANTISGVGVLNSFSSGSVVGSNNLIEDGSGGLTNTITADPLLGPLQNNGGPTQTMALLPNSPAINAAGTNPFPQLTSPTGVVASVTPFSGLLPANTTFYYRVTAINHFGETLASTEVQVTTGNDNNRMVKIAFNLVPGANAYKLYGRTQGSEQYLLTYVPSYSLANEFYDSGEASPSGALPLTNTTAAPSVDQRGVARPQGAAWDIGAFEVQAGAGAGASIDSATIAAAVEPLSQQKFAVTSAMPFSGVRADVGNERGRPYTLGVAASFDDDLLLVLANDRAEHVSQESSIMPGESSGDDECGADSGESLVDDLFALTLGESL